MVERESEPVPGSSTLEGTITAEPSIEELSPGQIQRAIRLSYAQAMLAAVYGASTGGMFLIGYALMLGAGNVQIGLMSTIPMLCIGVQLLAGAMIERGFSRRRLTFLGSICNVLGWLLIILIPYAFANASPGIKTAALISIITLVTLFAYASGNARGSWVGDLIPERVRGSFFGRITMFSAIIASIFAILEGRFLDTLKTMGIGAFSCLFGFGVVVGLVNAMLFLPQADVPVKRHDGASFWDHLRQSLANRPLLTVAAFATLWSMQSIAGPFYATYMIRDLHMSFLGIGLVNSVVVVLMIISAPFWGRIVDRYGCRAVLTVCSSTLGLVQVVWIPVTSAAMAYRIIPFANVLAGIAIGGVSVALSTLVYKVTPTVGRSIQFAVYSTIVTLLAAPMPVVGGKLAELLAQRFQWADLRLTFYAVLPLLVLAAIIARRIREPQSCRTREMLKLLPGEMIDHVQRQIESVLSLGSKAGE